MNHASAELGELDAAAASAVPRLVELSCMSQGSHVANDVTKAAVEARGNIHRAGATPAATCRKSSTVSHFTSRQTGKRPGFQPPWRSPGWASRPPFSWCRSSWY